MWKAAKTLLFVSASIGFGTASASDPIDVSGNRLLADCTAGYGIQDAFCMGFIIGAIRSKETEAAIATAFLDDAAGRVIALSRHCIPPEATLNQVRDVFVNRLRENPEDRHDPAVWILRSAMIDAFPCQ